MKTTDQQIFHKNIKQDVALKTFVVEEIRSRILHGQYVMGQRLSQNKLAQEMNTSRAPVQDALVTLCHEGLVQIIPQKGSFVFNPTQEEISDLYEVISLYETGALVLAMQKNAQALISRLEEALKATQKAENNAQDWVIADRLFHAAFIDAAGNPYLSQVYKSIMVRATVIVFKNTLSLDRMQKSFQEHLQIINYVKANQIEPAMNMLRQNNRITAE